MALRVQESVSSPPELRKWTREEYYRMSELGFFDRQRVMLIEGDIITMPPQKNDHAWAITILAEKLREIFGKDFMVREEKPLHLGEDSEPEPDIAVVKGSVASWRGKPHPAHAVLVVEVADTSLSLDRKLKAKLYAGSKIQEFWILNLVDRCVEVYRLSAPEPGSAGQYHLLARHSGTDRIASMEKPEQEFIVSEILP